MAHLDFVSRGNGPLQFFTTFVNTGADSAQTLQPRLQCL